MSLMFLAPRNYVIPVLPPSAEYDLYWENVVLLMHMDGANNSTAFIDETGKSITVSGNTKMITSEKKFGTAGAYFDDISNNALVAPPISLTSDFTIELWIKPTSLLGYIPLIGQWRQSVDLGSWLIVISQSKVIFALGSYDANVPLASSTTVLEINNWYHVAVAKQGNSTKLFINGNLESTATFAGNGFDLPTVNTSIGQYYNGSGTLGALGTTWYKGYMDDIRITKGVARYTSNFAVHTEAFPGAPMLEYDPYWDNVILLAHADGVDQSIDFKDSSSFNISLAATGLAKLSTVSPKIGSSSLSLGSTSSYVSGNVQPLGSGDFTVEFWLKPDGVNTEWRYPFKIGSIWSTASVGFGLYLMSAFLISNAESYSQVNYTFNLGEWYHIAIVKSNSVKTVYINGVSVHAAADTNNYTSTALQFGNGAVSLVSSLDEVRITKGVARYTSNFAVPTQAFPEAPEVEYDTYWNNVSLLMHMEGINQAQVFIDETGKALTLSGQAKVVNTTSRFGQTSAYFDGSGDQVLAPATEDLRMGTSDFTVEFWINPTSMSSYNCFVDCRTVNSNSTGFYIRGAATATSGQWQVGTGGGTLITPNVNLAFGVWQHVALVRSGTELKLYRNGVEVGQTTNSTNFTDNLFRIGQAIDGYGFNGFIDELRVTKGVARYTSAFSKPSKMLPGPAPLIDGYWDNVILLTHLDGINQSSILIDEKGHALTAADSALLSSAKSKFGSTSLLLDGIADRFSSPVSTDWDFGTQDFTIEGWIYFTAVTRNLTESGGNTAGTSNQYIFDLGANGYYFGWRSYDDSIGWSLSIGVNSGTNRKSPKVGQWYHWAVTRKGNLFRTFIDGTMVAGAMSSSAFGSSNSVLNIGCYGGGSSYGVIGYIDEVRITKGVARYIGNFNVPTSAFSGAPALDYDQYWNNLALLMHMDGANDDTAIVDETGKSVTAYGNARISNVQSRFGGTSAYFDGTGDYLLVPDSEDFNFGSQDFTVECWVYCTSASTIVQGIVGQWLESGGTERAWDLYRYNGKFEFVVNISGTNYEVSTPEILNSWVHVLAVRHQGTNLKLFVDGVLKSTRVLPSVSINNSTKSIGIGGYYIDSSTIGYFYNGYLDEVRVTKGLARYSANFNVPTQAFLAAPPFDPYWDNVVLAMHMDGADQSTAFIDETGKSSSLVQNSFMQNSISKFGGSALHLSPVSNSVFSGIRYPAHPDFVLESDFTIECWVYSTSNAQWDTYGGPTIFSFSNGGASGGAIQTVACSLSTDGSGIPNFGLRGNNSFDTNLTSNTPITVGSWHHLAITRSGVTARMFLNGVLVATDTSSNSAVGSATWTLNLGSLHYGEAQRPWRGYIDDLRITKGVARYTSNFIPSQVAFNHG